MTPSNTKPPPPTQETGLLQELRGKDFDRYACCLFAPPQDRRDLAALFLFNAELAQIRTHVTEPLLGQIRLQWWRDALAALGARSQPPHPLLAILASWRERCLNLAPLQRLLESRAADLANPPFPNSAAYESYRAGTSHPLGEMAALLLGQPQNARLYAATMESFAAMGHLRALPHWLKRRQMPLPPQYLAEYGISEALLAELKYDDGMRRFLRHQAHETLNRTRTLRQTWRALPVHERRQGMSILLHLELASCDARHIMKQPDSCDGAPPPLRLVFLLWRALRR